MTQSSVRFAGRACLGIDASSGDTATATTPNPLAGRGRDGLLLGLAVASPLSSRCPCSSIAVRNLTRSRPVGEAARNRGAPRRRLAGGIRSPGRGPRERGHAGTAISCTPRRCRWAPKGERRPARGGASRLDGILASEVSALAAMVCRPDGPPAFRFCFLGADADGCGRVPRAQGAAAAAALRWVALHASRTWTRGAFDSSGRQILPFIPLMKNVSALFGTKRMGGRIL